MSAQVDGRPPTGYTSHTYASRNVFNLIFYCAYFSYDLSSTVSYISKKKESKDFLEDF